jgi:hypothetical protein
LLDMFVMAGSPVIGHPDAVKLILQETEDDVCSLIGKYGITSGEWKPIGNRFVLGRDYRYGNEQILCVLMPKGKKQASFGHSHIENFVRGEVDGQLIAVGRVSNGGHIYFEEPAKKQVIIFLFNGRPVIYRGNQYRNWKKK